MSASISVDLTQPLWEDVPDKVRSEGKHLAGILKRVFDVSAASADVRIVINLYMEGKKPSQIPFGSSKVRLDKPIKNIVGARISVSKSEWSMPVAKFRECLWDFADKALVGCLGTLAKRGTHLDIDKGKFLSDLTRARAEFLPQGVSSIKRAESPVGSSFQKTGPDDKNRMIIQYKIKGHGNGRDHDKRVAVENLLGEFLEEFDLGYCDGGDIGSGTMNVFCFVKPKRGVGKKIIEVLRKNSLLDGATIAETTADEERVIWPPDFEGEFKLIYR